MALPIVANRWWTVIASMLALMVGTGPITVFAAATESPLAALRPARAR